MKILSFATIRETQHDGEDDYATMEDEGCPNDPAPSLPNKLYRTSPRCTAGYWT